MPSASKVLPLLVGLTVVIVLSPTATPGAGLAELPSAAWGKAAVRHLHAEGSMECALGQGELVTFDDKLHVGLA